MQRWMRHATAGASLLALALAPSALRADPVSDFYKGRQITMILSADAGGGYGSYANAFAPYLSQHIPGKPKIIVQYMPGAGGLRAMNYLYSAAPKDGTIIALVHSRPCAFAPLYGMSAAKFDPRKMNWLGSIDATNGICVAWHDSKIKTWQDLFDKQYVVGGSGAGSQMETLPAMLNKLFGTKIKVISGYRGGNEVYLAMERGEVDRPCCGSLVSSINSTLARLVCAEEGVRASPDRARTRSAIPGCASSDRTRQGCAHQADPAAHPFAHGDGPAHPDAARRAGGSGLPR